MLKRYALISCVVLAAANSAIAAPSGTLTVYHAGSLSVPFAKIEKQFEEKYPEVDVQRKAGGSTKMARLISEKGDKVDIMASADYVVIDKNLIPQYADSNIRFASNRLVLCYTDKSRFASEIDEKNWPQILQKEGVVWGHSDPNLDPCGYRSLMVLQLAEKFLKQDGLADDLIANRPKENIKAKAVQLIKLLKSGEMDYAWEYRSVAEQHGLRYVELDDHMNLGNYKMDDYYKQAKVVVTGKKEGTTVDRIGKSITYGVTMIKESANPEASGLFMEYLLDPQGGMSVLEDMGQPIFTPGLVANAGMQAALPKAVQQFVVVK